MNIQQMVISMLLVLLTSCSGGDDTPSTQQPVQTQSDWDTMVWDQGDWE